MSEQRTLVVELLPALPGCTVGIVGKRWIEDDRGEHVVWDLQCQTCGAIESTSLLIQMRTKFHSCAPRHRTCQPCHEQGHADGRLPFTYQCADTLGEIRSK